MDRRPLDRRSRTDWTRSPGDPLNPIHYSGCFPEFRRVRFSAVSVLSVDTYVRMVFRSVSLCSAPFYALVLTEQARFKEAIEVHQRVLELRRRVFHLEVADHPRAISSSSSSTRAPPSTPPSPTPSGNSSSTSPCPTTSTPESPESSRPALSPPTAIPAHPRIPAAHSAFLTPPRSPASPHVRLGRARARSIPVLAPTPRPISSRLLPSKPV